MTDDPREDPATDHDLFPDAVGTDRLQLVALTAGTVDLDEYYRICSGRADENFERVTRYVPWDPHDHPKESREFLESLSERREAGTNAEFAVRPEEGEDGAGRLAGVVGLAPHWERRAGELGIWLREPFWGRGYAGETLRALARVAFDRLDLAVVEAAVRADNEASTRALETFVTDLGGRREARLRSAWRSPVDDRPLDEVRYTVTREEWTAATRD